MPNRHIVVAAHCFRNVVASKSGLWYYEASEENLMTQLVFPFMSELEPAKPAPILPNLFDTTCRLCNENQLEIVCTPILSRQKPFATLYCSICKVYLYLFGTLDDPLVVQSNKIRGATKFSEVIDSLFEKRRIDRERKQVRQHGRLIDESIYDALLKPPP